VGTVLGRREVIEYAEMLNASSVPPEGLRYVVASCLREVARDPGVAIWPTSSARPLKGWNPRGRSTNDAGSDTPADKTGCGRVLHSLAESLTVVISRVRRKIEAMPERPFQIFVSRGGAVHRHDGFRF
jgi:hypothetical protein